MEQKIDQWLTKTVKLPQYIPCFIEQGFEDCQFIHKLTHEQLESMGVKLGHIYKILNHAQKSSPTTTSKSHSNSNSNSNSCLYDQLTKQRMRQEEKLQKLLKKKGFVRKKPEFLHAKAKKSYYVPSAASKGIKKNKKIFNQFVIEVNSQADLEKSHWDDSMVTMEATFRAELDSKMKSIKDDVSKLQINNYKSFNNIVSSLKFAVNKSSKINTHANQLIKNISTSKRIIIDINDLKNKINNQTVNVLHILDKDLKPITYKTKNRSFWKTNQITVIKDQKILNHYNKMRSTLNSISTKVQEYIQKIQNEKSYKEVQKRSKKKIKYNKQQNIKSTKYYKDKMAKKKLNKKRKNPPSCSDEFSALNLNVVKKRKLNNNDIHETDEKDEEDEDDDVLINMPTHNGFSNVTE